jgi:hypothetical protein
MAGVTFRTETATDFRRALRTLAVIFMILVALWASSGGLAGMLAAEADAAAVQRHHL